MLSVTSVEAQSRFGELIDRSQREPIAVTRRGRTVAYVVSGHDMEELSNVCLLYTSPSPRDRTRSRMPSSA